MTIINQVRENISKVFNYAQIYGWELEEIITKYSDSYYELENHEVPQMYVFKNLILNVIYLDSYKILSYKQKEGTITEEEEFLFLDLINIESEYDLISEVSADPDFLKKLIKYSYEFSQYDSLTRILLVKSLSLNEHEDLLHKTELHQEDINEYNLKITLETIKQAYLEKKERNNDFNKGILMSLQGFIKNLVKLNYKSALDLLLEISKIDYLTANYLKKNDIQEEYILDHVEFYEKEKIDTIIYRYLFDQDFLKDSIWLALSSLVEEQYNTIPISINLITQEKNEKVLKKIDKLKK